VYVPHLLRQNRNLWGYFDTCKGKPKTTLAEFNSPRMHGFEMPGANGLSNGVGLATIAAAMAGRGTLGDARILSERAYNASFGGQVKMKDAHIGVRGRRRGIHQKGFNYTRNQSLPNTAVHRVSGVEHRARDRRLLPRCYRGVIPKDLRR
jgi:hypothetical protein